MSNTKMKTDSKNNIKKRRKDTFAADTLDNNAPVEKIVDYLEANNKHNKAYKFYNTNLRQSMRRHTLHFLVPGHPLSLFNEDWDGGLNSGYFERFSHKSMKPKMITEIRNMEVRDPLTELISKKTDWNFKWRIYRRSSSLTSTKYRYKWHNENILECPKAYVEMAQHWEQDPDVFFDCNYNWYYAGNGNMQQIAFNGSDYILHSELDCLYIIGFSKNNLTLHYDKEILYKCDKDRHILETVSSQNLIAIRTKNKITILKLVQTDDNISVEKLKDVESELPFTSVSFDEYHKNILYITTLDQKLTIVNIDRMSGRSKQLKGLISTIKNNWSAVIGSERSYYTHIMKKSIVLYDKRTNNAFQRWKGMEQVADEFLCNDITVGRHCKGKPLMYFGTEHHLFLMDMRYNTNRKLIPVERWTHGMQCPPTYISMCDVENNKEFVFLSSQWCEDMCVTSNCSDRLSHNIRSVCIPYRPPSVFSTLREAHQKSLLCELENPINSRLSTAISGMVVSPQGENFYILMQNSLGDISSHALFPEHMTMFIDDDSVEQLYEWSRNYRVNPKQLKVSKVVDIKDLWSKLKKVPGDYKFEESKYMKDSNFNEKDIFDDFENEELESGLLDIWINEQGQKEGTVEEELSQFFE